MSFLHCFFTIRPNFDYLRFLIADFKMDIEECDVNGITALGHVYKENNYQQMQFLVAMGANIDKAMFENGKTMLMDAAMKGDSKLFAFILK